jgi:hypothetical protein
MPEQSIGIFSKAAAENRWEDRGTQSARELCSVARAIVDAEALR